MERTQRPKPLGFLVIRRGPGSGQIFTITRTRTTIGRSKQSQLVIPDPEISRKHAVITTSGTGFTLEDLDSTNGTLLNKHPIRTSPLQHGDTIALGPHVLLTFYCELPKENEAPSRVVRLLPALLPILAVLLSAVLLTCLKILQPQPTRTTARLIHPLPGSSIHTGSIVELLAVGQSDLPVRRVEIWLDGSLLQHYTDLESSMPTLYLQADAVFDNPGEHTVLVRSFDSAGNRAHSLQTIVITKPEDADGDGIIAAKDVCPDIYGSPTASGCPDSDRDGTADAVDACPGIPGVLPAAGCPAVRPDDGDGDGIPDRIDMCPEIPGIGTAAGCLDSDDDSLPDPLDSCPEQPGPSSASGCPLAADLDGDQLASDEDSCPREAGEYAMQGCPDRDADSLMDSLDSCPALAGTADSGCPDTDIDGTIDPEDFCPTAPGSSEFSGCPPTDPPDADSDQDGVPDSLDLCPGISGFIEFAGCNPPGAAADSDKSGIVDEWELDSPVPASRLITPLLVQLPDNPIPLELELVSLKIPEISESAFCFVDISGAAEIKYSLGPLTPSTPDGVWKPESSQAFWQSTFFTADRTDYIQLHITCTSVLDDTQYSSAAMDRRIPPDEWNGEALQSIASSRNSEESFILEYRICENSCSTDGPVSGPHTVLNNFLGQQILMWVEPGGLPTAERYNLYLNGALAWSVPPDITGIRVDLHPPCGQSWNLHLTSMRDGVESSPGNPVLLAGDFCRQSANVHLESIRILDVPEDEHIGEIGPVRGSLFAASSSEYRNKPWNTAWSNEDLVSVSQCSADGLYLQEDTYSLDYISEWVETRQSEQSVYGALNVRAASYFSPAEPIITLAHTPGHPLTLGFTLEELDCPGGHHDILLQSELRISRLTSDTYILSNAYAEIEIRVDVSSGTGVEPLPTPQ